MREEMLKTLAAFFNKHGKLDREQYRIHPDVSYSYRDIRRVFKQYLLMEAAIDKLPKAVPKAAPRVVPKAPIPEVANES